MGRKGYDEESISFPPEYILPILILPYIPFEFLKTLEFAPLLFTCSVSAIQFKETNNRIPEVYPSLANRSFVLVMEMEIEENRKLMVLKRGETSDKEASAADVENMAITGEEDGDSSMVSEEMEMAIARIHEKIERFTQMVSELLESGNSMLKELGNQFEEKIILIHKEQIDKWQEEIKELQMIDASNQEAFAVLVNAKSLFDASIQEDFAVLGNAKRLCVDLSNASNQGNC